MAGLRTSLAALLLLLAGADIAARDLKPVLQCVPYPYSSVPSLQVCTELDPAALGPVGRTTIWRVRIKSGWKPVLIRLHNASPGVVRLEGGNDQIRHMGCVRHHEIQLKVTSVGPGIPNLAARPYDPSPEQESSAIAASLAPLLARIETDFRERWARLAPSPGYSAEAVAELLNRTESELLQALNYRELAALRDYVRKHFKDARSTLEQARQVESKTSLFPSRPFRVVFASLVHGASSRGESVPQPVTDSLLGDILGKIHRLFKMASSSDMVASLCVTSAPGTGARFSMRPQLSEAAERMEINTDGELRAYRGLYVFSIRKGRKQRIDCEELDNEDCFLIDLVDDPKPVLHCNFNQENCERSGPVPAGVCHGNGF